MPIRFLSGSRRVASVVGGILLTSTTAREARDETFVITKKAAWEQALATVTEW